MTAKNSILAINNGSSSVKFQLFLQHAELPLLAKGQMYNLGNTPLFVATTETKSPEHRAVEYESLPVDCTHETAIHFIMDWIEAQKKNWRINAVVHRIVHGGLKFINSLFITPEIFTDLEKLTSLAPLHQPHNLAAVKIISALMPNVIQIACFDTAFHAYHSPLFTEYALPENMRDKGIRRYGFHGLSYEWIVHSLQLEAPQLVQGRIIAAHLGNGASLCAMNNGISIDTTMGMTALDGLPMGSRCGALDPGAVIYMIRELGLSADEVESILYNESGLLGLSQWTKDMKLLQNSDEPAAQFALNYFCLRTAQFMGLMAVTLGGVDGIVFTGGIGEHSTLVRDKILQHLALFRPFATRIVPANEERMMAMHSISLLN